MSRSFYMRSRAGGQRIRTRGMALVLVLAILVLLTGVVLTFFSLATSSRQIEASRLHREESDVLAKSAADYIVAQFLAEISDPAQSDEVVVGDETIYVPRTPADRVPRRGIGSLVPVTDADFANLIRQSHPASDPNSSNHPTSQPASNGRVLSTAFWNQPKLIAGSGYSDDGQLPQWVYITSDDGPTDSPDAKVIGRFAYNVYDVAGLLNINVAGFPSFLNATQAAALKHSQVGADLTALPNVEQDAVDDLIEFRNPEALSSGGAYVNAVAGGLETGFLSPKVSHGGDSFQSNFFTSRQDLLRYVRTRNPGLDGALPYVTHFSRSRNTATWEPPDLPANTNPSFLEARFANDTPITRYRDDGSSTSVIVQAGDSILSRRFSLAKLDWLRRKEESPGETTLDAAIRACFGLQWNNGLARWEYVEDLVGGEILPLTGGNSVASRNREPNFFELLRAGILDNSLGLAAENPTLAGSSNSTFEQNKALHLARIAANIVDCADNDNFPTIIAVPVGGVPVEVAGVEDLPYFYAMGFWAIYDRLASNLDNINKLNIICTPVLINPHRAASTPVSSSDTPSNAVVSIASGRLESVFISNGDLRINGIGKDLNALDPIPVASSGFANFRLAPNAVRDALAPNRLGALVSLANAETDALTFLIYSYENEAVADGLPPPWVHPNSSHNPRVIFSNLMVRLQCPARNGMMKTYSIFAGNEANPTSGIGNGAAQLSTGIFMANGNGSPNNSNYFASWDPRTNRLGPSWGGRRNLSSLPAFSGTSDGLRMNLPNMPTTSATPYLLGLVPQGGKSAGAAGEPFNFRDPDGVFRPADGWLGDDANPYRQRSGANLITDHVSRPVLLQRPYRSVAELGYVFRDVPWKSLSFFDETSADAALLDLFCVSEEAEVTAGRVHLASRQAPVIQALIQSTAQNEDGTSEISGAVASNLATALMDRSYDANGDANPTDHPANVADLVEFMSSGGLDALGAVKSQREAVVRALSDSTQTRTWNLFVDVVAQSGRFPGTDFGADAFVVESEKRYWVSLAIDRLTGEVVDQEFEGVFE